MSTRARELQVPLGCVRVWSYSHFALACSHAFCRTCGLHPDWAVLGTWAGIRIIVVQGCRRPGNRKPLCGCDSDGGEMQLPSEASLVRASPWQIESV